MSVKRVKFKESIGKNYYNFSFNENIIKKLYENSDKSLDYKIFKNNIYLKVTRNYLRYRWLIIYLLGCTSVVHETFNYDSVKDYVDSINKFIDEDLIDSHKELYAPIRLKAKNPKSFLNSLLDDGINYLEYRSIDINPFEKCGISLDDLYFLNLFNIFLLIEDESLYKNWQQDALLNQNIIAMKGQNDVDLVKDGKNISKIKWGIEILNKIKLINDELNLNQDKIIDDMIDKIKDYKKTYTYKMIEKVKSEGYINAHLNLAKNYKNLSYDNRFKLQGYEDLELSTQILIKEAIGY